MVEGKFKSGRFRKMKQKVPGGRTVTRHKERTPNQAKCGQCGKVLHGIPRMFATEARNAAKTTKRPERPYAGVLCSSCTRAKIKAQYQ